MKMQIIRVVESYGERFEITEEIDVKDKTENNSGTWISAVMLGLPIVLIIANSFGGM